MSLTLYPFETILKLNPTNVRPVPELDPYIPLNLQVVCFTTGDGQSYYSMVNDSSTPEPVDSGLGPEQLFTESIFHNEPPRIVQYLQSLPDQQRLILADRFQLGADQLPTLSAKMAMLMWRMGRTFPDLRALMEMTVRGLFPLSPGHHGPLYMESALIDLAELNRLDLITVDSQPAIPRDYQRPYLDFYYHRDKVDRLIEQLLHQVPTATVHTVDPQTGINRFLNYPKDLHFYWRADPNSYLVISQESPRLNIFGPNFAELVRDQLVSIHLTDTRCSNDLFIQLASIARRLL